MEAATRNGKSVRLSVRLGALLLAFALTFSACTVGRLKEDPSRESTNPRPENYKSDILAMLHVYLRDPTQIRDAAASEPKLQLVGQRTRYVVCLRFNAKKAMENMPGRSNTWPFLLPAGWTRWSRPSRRNALALNTGHSQKRKRCLDSRAIAWRKLERVGHDILAICPLYFQ